MDPDDIPTDPLECAIYLRNNVTSLTTEGGSDAGYRLARERLMADLGIRRLLPTYIRHSHDAATLRTMLSTIASGDGSWRIRRKHVADTFGPVLNFLETGGAADAAITDGLQSYDAPGVQAVWSKALERRVTDPEGAVTLASTLLEEVCKHIIEDDGGEWEERWSLPKLYADVAQRMNLAPSQHHEETFKTILGSCQSIVQTIGSFRNKGGGDAHGGGRKRVRPLPRHAALTVNLAGSMALFLIETWQARAAGG